MDNIWVLNTDYAFKNDKDRICMYSMKYLKNDSSIDWVSYIHPVQAMILSLFTEKRKLSEILSDLSQQFGLSTDKTYSLIKDFLGNPTPIFTEWKGQKVFFPKNVLLKANELKEYSYNFEWEDLKCSSVDLNPDRSHKSPHTALWILTTKCLTNCKYCYADRATQYAPISLKKAFDLIEEFKELHMESVDIIGGEIMLYKDWDIILKRLIDYGMSPTFISTKVPMTRHLVSKLIATGFRNTFQISLDSVNDETLKSIIGSQVGYVKRIKNGISLLEELNIPIRVDTILTAQNANIAEIDALYQFISKIMNLELWEIRVPDASIYSCTTFEEIKASMAQIVALRDYINTSLKPKANIKIIFSDDSLEHHHRQCGPEIDNFPGGSCGMLMNRVVILPDGKITICEQLYWQKEYIIGDLNISTLKDVWNSHNAIRIFSSQWPQVRGSSQCSRCTFLDACNSKKRKCPVKVLRAYGPHNWDYPDPRCVFAPVPTTAIEYK